MRRRNRLVGTIMTIALMIALLPATAFADTYELWVGGVQVTDENKNNITSDLNNTATGIASFDSDTKTLTLNSYSYLGPGYSFLNSVNVPCAAAIYSELDKLNITLVDTNSVSNSLATADNSYGIYTKNGDLVIAADGTGSLTATGGDASGISHGIWCFSGGISVGENTQLVGVGGNADISRGVCVFNKLVVNGGSVEGTGGSAGSISHGISAGTIESTSEKSKIIGTAGTSTGESAGIYIWNSATFSKGHMKGIGGSSSTDESYGIYVNGDDKLTVIGGTVTAQGKTRNVVYLNDGGQGEAIPAPDSSPNTGDNSNMILWLALLLVSGGAIIVAVVLGRKRK